MLQRVEFADVQRWKSLAAAEHVSISETAGTSWHGWMVDGEMVGFCALMMARGGGRIKGVWVKPAHRHQGHGRQMTLALIHHATEDLLLGRLEALALNPAFYESLGWTRQGEPRPNGAVWVARNY